MSCIGMWVKHSYPCVCYVMKISNRLHSKDWYHHTGALHVRRLNNVGAGTERAPCSPVFVHDLLITA